VRSLCDSHLCVFSGGLCCNLCAKMQKRLHSFISRVVEIVYNDHTDYSCILVHCFLLNFDLDALAFSFSMVGGKF